MVIERERVPLLEGEIAACNLHFVRRSYALESILMSLTDSTVNMDVTSEIIHMDVVIHVRDNKHE